MLILGSSSKPRQELMRRLHIPFDVAHPDTDETPLAGESPSELVLRLAACKAQAVGKQYPNSVIIGADQVGVLEGEILGKPLAYEQGVAQLQKISGKRIQFLIGLSVLDNRSRQPQQQTVLETFDVVFRPLTIDMIEHYLQKEYALECAGSFKAEGLGIALVDEFHGKDFSALIGLPLIRLVSMLEHVGIRTI